MAASSAARWGMVLNRTCSWVEWAPSPTAPKPSRVGMPRAAVKLPSDAPPAAASPSAKPICLARRFGATVEFNAVFAFERRAIEAAAQLKFDATSNCFQSAESFFQSAHVGVTPGAKIKINFGAVGNDVGASAAIDEIRIHGNAVTRIVPFFDPGDLRGEFMNSVNAPVRIQASVSGAAMDDEFDFTNALAGSFDHATSAERGFQNKNSIAALGFRFQNLARRFAADFFIGSPQENKALANRNFCLL